MNPVEIEQAISTLAEQPFDAEEFPYLLLQAFGNKDTTLKRLRAGHTNSSDLDGVLQRDKIHIAVTAHGEVTAIEEATRTQMQVSLMSRREQMVSDGVMLTYDQDHWNDAHPDDEPIQLPMDLSFDIELLRNAPDEEDGAA